MRVTLADGLYTNCSTTITLYLKLYGHLQLSLSGMSELVHIGYSVLCCFLPNLASDMVLGMDWLDAINPLIDCNIHSQSSVCESKPIRFLSTK